MKKNMLMRAASGLFVATMVTSSVVSGTYAKYVTSDSASDTARVAKWGVEVTADGTLFAKTYKNATGGNTSPGDSDADATLTVSSSPEANVVAPGTKNNTGLSFSIKGKPEVAVKLSIVVTGAENDGVRADTATDIFLKSTDSTVNKNTITYSDPTGVSSTGFTLSADYYPIKYTLQQKKADETDFSDVTGCVNVPISTIEAYLEALSTEENSQINPNTELAKTYGDYRLTWTWDYGEETLDNGYDQADTVLGDLAAETTITATANSAEYTLTSGTDYNLTTDVQIAITVTQVD